MEIAKARKLENLPDTANVVPMPKCVIPDVANHISSVIIFWPQPFERVGPIDAVKNRYRALKGYGIAVALIGMMNLDEYPFASSSEGGAGASVCPVPIRQNAIQGGIIGACYAMEKIEVGESFYVVVTP